MLSCCQPHVPLDIDYIQHILFGFSTFIVLCSVKTYQIMNNQQAVRRTRTHWSVEETHKMLKILTQQRSKMRQSFNFPSTVFAEVAKKLGPNKHLSAVSSKWQTVCRHYTCFHSVSLNFPTHSSRRHGGPYNHMIGVPVVFLLFTQNLAQTFVLNQRLINGQIL